MAIYTRKFFSSGTDGDGRSNPHVFHVPLLRIDSNYALCIFGVDRLSFEDKSYGQRTIHVNRNPQVQLYSAIQESSAKLFKIR